MATLNRCIFIGRLTDNPEPPRTMPNSGSTVVKFRFAVGKSRKNPQTGAWENDPNPLYLDCEAWGKPDSQGLVNLIAQHFTKGKEVLLEGRLQFEQWDDKNNPGQKRSKHKLVVEQVQMLGGKSDGDGDGYAGPKQGGYQQRPQREQTTYGQPATSSYPEDDSIPF